MATLTQLVAAPIGDVRQFGPWGPQYEVLAEAMPENGKRMARIVLVQSGEELDYPVENILLDPEAE